MGNKLQAIRGWSAEWSTARRAREPEIPPPAGVDRESVWARARRDTRLWSQNTLWALPLLVFAIGLGGYLFSKDHASGKPAPGFLELIVGPLLGVLAVLSALGGVRLLMTLYAQRNDARHGWVVEKGQRESEKHGFERERGELVGSESPT